MNSEYVLNFFKLHSEPCGIQPQDFDFIWRRKAQDRQERDKAQAKANKEYAIAQGTYKPKKRGKYNVKGKKQAETQK